MSYELPKLDVTIPDAVATGEVQQTRVLIVGAGPIGMTLALEMGMMGHHVILIDRDTSLSDGSRAICYAKRPLEILDRLGVAEKMLAKGVKWNIGRVFFKDRSSPIYSFDLLPVKDQKLPAMINLQQYYNEAFILEALTQLDNVELRWGNTLNEVENLSDGVIASITTPEGDYRVQADWLIACDGHASPTRKMLGMGFEGETFNDNFLIADVKFKKPYPTERHFWFDPPFNPGQSVLLHKQPDDVWRVDFQVGQDIDRKAIVKPENVAPRIKAMFGDDVEFEFEWISVYTFNCRQIDKMIQGRVIFAGDSAHLVSPFGARGANTGFQDSDNLAWKLDMIIRGQAGQALLESYDTEREIAARINILNSTRSTDFITPKSKASMQFRNAVLELSTQHQFARGFVNSGRLSLPVPYPDSPLNTNDEQPWEEGISPGTNCIDAPVSDGGSDGWLLSYLGWRFKLIIMADPETMEPALLKEIMAMAQDEVPVDCVFITENRAENVLCLADTKNLVMQRYGLASGGCYLIRPDQYVAGRWQQCDPVRIRNAVQRAIGNVEKNHD